VYYIVYKTTNKLNSKTYIGVHSQDDPDIFDGYLGSGKSLWNSIKKYGESNFIRETLFVFDNDKTAYEKEAELVTEDFCKLKSNYNIIPGGQIPPSHKNVKRSTTSKSKISIANIERWKNPEYKKNIADKISASWKNRIVSDETKFKMSQIRKNRKWSDEVKAKIGKSNEAQRKIYIIENIKTNETIHSTLIDLCATNNLNLATVKNVASKRGIYKKTWKFVDMY
jgi:hypothetical protein